MFEEKQLGEYKSIKAPHELKDRIIDTIGSDTQKHKPLYSRNFVKTLSTVAACIMIVMVIMIAVRVGNAPVTLSYNGSVVGEESVSISGIMPLSMESRQITPDGICLELDLSRKATVSVSTGEIYTEREEELKYHGKEAVLNSNQIIWWIPAAELGEHRLTVDANGEITVYVLEITETAPQGVIYKTNQK